MKSQVLPSIPAVPEQQSKVIPQQLDVEALDEYLYSLLHPDGLLRYFPKLRDGLFGSLRSSLLPIITILASQGKTPACQALGLKIEPKEKHHRDSFKIRLIVYTFLSFILPQLYEHVKRKWFEQNRFHQITTNEISSSSNETENMSHIARERRRKVVESCFRALDSVMPLIRLGLLQQCWRGKRQSSATIGLWLSGLQYTNDQSAVTTPALHTLFAHRRWLHHEAMRLVPMLFSPLQNSAKETYSFVSSSLDSLLLQPVNRYISKQSKDSVQDRNDRCPICQDESIVIPYETDCGHVYCYTCLWDYTERNSNAKTCSICYKSISSCRPYTYNSIGN